MEKKGHVVLIPYPSQGHINPLLQFAKRLVSKGLKATLATTHYTVNSISATNVGVEPISDGFDEGGFAYAPNEQAYLKSFKENGSRTLSELVRKFESSSFPVNCIVFDSFLPWALDVAKQNGIYGASFFTYSPIVSSLLCHIHHGLFTLPFKQDDIPLLLPGIPPLNFRDLPSFVKSPESCPAYLEMLLNQYSNLDMADWIFFNSFEELEIEAIKGSSSLWRGINMIGPMVPSAYLDRRIKEDRRYGANLLKLHRDEYSEWLESKPVGSVVYVSFGSMVSLTVEQMEEIALGLKGSNFHFLWVVKESDRAKLPDWFIDSTKEKGLITTWCDQLEVLAHQAVGCFVTHCGWNSILEGLSLEVPMVGVPKWVDQMTNAKLLEEVWGVGMRAEEDEKGTVGREEVVMCLREIMEGKRRKEVKRNVNKWRELAKEAISEGGSSDKNIDEFVGNLMRRKIFEC